MSGRRFNRFLHGFLERDQGCYNMLGILSGESDFLSREGEGTNITQKSLKKRLTFCQTVVE